MSRRVSLVAAHVGGTCFTLAKIPSGKLRPQDVPSRVRGRKDLPPHKVGARTATRLTERSRFHLERAPAP